MSITTRKDRAAVLRTILAILFALGLVLVAFLVWFVRAPIPKIDGTLEVGGVSAPVSIRRDERGTPHIEAQTVDDALFAEGFACAQDRLWQMDTLRRRAEGSLSEFAGPAALDADRYMRTLGLGAVARSDAASLDAASRAELNAYAAGINAAAASHPLPIEFKLIGYGWEPWTPSDTLAVIELEAQQLDDQWYYQTIKAAFVARFGVGAADALVDMQMPKLERHIPGYDAQKSRSNNALLHTRGARLENALLQPLRNWPGHERDTGSNNWMVSGTRTSTSRPVLSNDTHLSRTLPSIWWIVDLHGGRMHVAGLTLPGIPGVVIGHNERIAWGITSAVEGVQDLYIERFRSAGSDEYLAGGAWRKAQHRVERIGVKGQPDVVLDVLVTRHGPVIERKGTRGIALAWTVLRGGNTIAALAGVDVAANYQQFRAALSHSIGPVLNFGYADVDGHIGYQDSGVVPLRANGDGSLPVEGQDDRYAWRGSVPFDALPHALDPPAGYLETANQELVAPSYRPILSTFFEPPFRVNRIATLLAGMSGATPKQIGSVQGDAFDYPRLQLARATARLLRDVSDPALRGIPAQLGEWDGVMRADSRLATFIVVEETLLKRDLFEQKMGAALLKKYDENYWPMVPLLRALEGDAGARAAGITRASVETAVRRAAREAIAGLGPGGLGALEPWGRRNAALYRHPLSAKAVLGFLSPGPVVEPGSAFSIYANRPDHGPSQRLVVDLSNFDNSSMLVPLGESGEFSDPHYDDQLDDFTDVRWVPTPFSRAAVLTATKHTLVLRPTGR